jgi:para-nitrobenzyl esterase
MQDVSGLLFDPAVMGDDCLNLNIWTPDVGAVGLPVMVFSPGGAFRFNSGSSYDGSRFARDGVMCVTINWRTGADDFLYLGEGDDGANLGLLDQVAALIWVRENIGAFGCDPDRVTVFGESAGAMSIGDLLSMPRAKGIFRRAARVGPAPARARTRRGHTAARPQRYRSRVLAGLPRRTATRRGLPAGAWR